MASQPAAVPAAIQRLDDAVVHRIAAGEVVQRPASALKEMLENSLDAGARHITVVLKEGGLKYMQIQDDGCGVRLEDMPILCHRHTTSKLRAYEDLDTISTLGFRGEALASISFVSHVTVTTMTASMQHGYRVRYSDGEMLPPGPKPVAAVPGTSIIVEDMFYNMLPRKRAFRPGPEEHNLCLDVLQKYAIYKAGSAGFTLKRQGEARSDLHTLPTSPRLDVIRSLLGPDLAASLLPLQLTGGSGDVSAAVPLDGPLGFKVDGFVSNLTHIGRRSTLILFINGRPVDQGQLKRALEAVYVAQNPKANKPWVFLDLQLPPRHVEVNVHPTKKEVGFLHQQEVIDAVCGAVEGVLRASMNSRSFAVNKPSLLAAPPAAAAAAAATAEEPGEAAAAAADQQDAEAASRPASARPGSATAAAGTSQRPPSSSSKSQSTAATQQQTPQTQPYYRPEKLVRTDHRSQTIDGFLVSQASAAAVASAAAAAPRRRSSAAAGRSSVGGAADGDAGDGAVLLSNAALHLQAAAAEEAAAAAEWQQQQQGADRQGQQAPQQQQQQQQQMFMLRAARQPKLPPVVTQLSSVHELLDEVAAAVHGELQELFRQHTWVGMADDRLALLQHGTRLYLVDTSAISRDLFRQLLLARWEAPRVMALAEPLPVRQLMAAALQLEEAAGRWQPEPGSSRQELCELVEALLTQKAEMLQEYVGLTFSSNPKAAAAAAQQDADLPGDQQQQQQVGLHLTGLPLLLDGYVPDLASLPQLVLQLVRDVDWDTEQACFSSLASVLAGFYALQPLLLPSKQERAAATSAGSAAAGGSSRPADAAEDGVGSVQPMDIDGEAAAAAAAGPSVDAPTRVPPGKAAASAAAGGLLGAHRDQQQREWLLRHVVMPGVKAMYRPPKERARDGSVLLLTSMEKLYRVFERCGW
uniref:DNA mismatch repair protein S5 domain-containing protein n=1 Tax=Tetradesmus obliquus TaxID=3088 RepID=A0A383V9C2_TETOB|eukprot:jgi/Sobl393_1/6459/SZX61349.1